MLKKALLAHAAIEIVIGLLLLWNPKILGMVGEVPPTTAHIAKLYGILAFIFGVICYQLWTRYESNDMYRKIVLAIMAFHLMVGLYTFGLYRQGVLGKPGAGVFHLGMATIFAIFYMQEEAGKRDR